MLGYMTATQAKHHGFTHHGSYYGIPTWMTVDEEPMVATKWAPFESLMKLAHYVEGFCHYLQQTEPGFVFKVGDPI